MNHCFKQKPARKTEPTLAIRELVAKYGDNWSVMAGCDAAGVAMWRTRWADWTSDRNEAYNMLQMEKGDMSRCGESE